MTTLIVLFNLKDGVDAAAYEQWAQSTDLPTVRNLDSCDRFDVYRGTGMLGSDAAPAYEYVEMIEVNDMARFGEEVSTETMKKVAGEFKGFADKPMFIVTQRLGT